MKRRHRQHSPEETGRDGPGVKKEQSRWIWGWGHLQHWGCCALRGRLGSVLLVLLHFHHPLCLLTSMEEILADSEDEEEEEEERQRGKEWRKQARQKGQAWLKEGEEDEPLNFLDPNVSQRVLGEERSFTCGWGGMDGAGTGVGYTGVWGYDYPREGGPSPGPDASLCEQPPSQAPSGPEE